jgi:glycosyltransferase involved in cell wall biosynthesis
MTEKTTAVPVSADGSPLCIAQMIESDGQGGAEILMLDLAVELRRRGHRVVPVGPPKKVGWLGERFRERGFELLMLGNRRPLDLQCLWRLRDSLKGNGVDVVHSHEFSMCVYGSAAAGLLGIPHVTTMHGNQEMTRALRRRVALRWAFRRSAARVAVSHATRQSLADELGVAPASIDVVLNGVPVVRGEGQGVRSEFAIQPGELLLLALGTVVPRKGHMVLLRALHRLAEGLPALPWKLIIGGRLSGDEPAKLRGYIEEAGLGHRVHLAGQRPDVANLLAAADIFVMPSLWEGLPLAVLEAMLAAKPIVASATSGIPEAITDGVEGLLVPPGDEAALAAALARVMGEPSLRTALSQQALERARREFTIESMADRYERIYRLALASARR